VGRALGVFGASDLASDLPASDLELSDFVESGLEPSALEPSDFEVAGLAGGGTGGGGGVTGGWMSPGSGGVVAGWDCTDEGGVAADCVCSTGGWASCCPGCVEGCCCAAAISEPPTAANINSFPKSCCRLTNQSSMRNPQAGLHRQKQSPPVAVRRQARLAANLRPRRLSQCFT
jgi:hypothetical protein